MRRRPRFPNSQHRAPSDVYSGLAENLKPLREADVVAVASATEKPLDDILTTVLNGLFSYAA